MCDYVLLIFKVVGIVNLELLIILVNDKSFNVFVLDLCWMFINIGVFFEVEMFGEVIVVIVYEMGYIEGCYFVWLRFVVVNVQIMFVIGMIVGVGVVVVGVVVGFS